MSTRTTQRDSILALLETGHWVPAWRLAKIGLRYGARIHELREEGVQIERKQETVRGQVHSAYRLLRAPAGSADPLDTLLEQWYERIQQR